MSAERQGTGETYSLRQGQEAKWVNVETCKAEQLSSILGEGRKANMKIHQRNERLLGIETCQNSFQNTWEGDLDYQAPAGVF